jgi:hypothetical protein
MDDEWGGVDMITETQPTQDEQDRLYKAAKTRAEALQGFLTHLSVYVVINGSLFLITS